MNENLQDAIELVNQAVSAFCHYITPNDLGITGGHQCGYYFPHYAEMMFYGKHQVKGTNDERIIQIKWQKDFVKDNHAKYYGVGTRNENRITCFGRGFEFMQDKYVGSLLIFTKGADENFDGYVLADQDNIENFMATFNLCISIRNQMIKDETVEIAPEERIQNEILAVVERLGSFPSTTEMANFAEDIFNTAYHQTNRLIYAKCDTILPKWIDTEYKLFTTLEEKLYKDTYTHPFNSCQDLIAFSNSILNRRKSRAGKSLEHHLSTIFTCADLQFEEQVHTERKKTPDFIFPDVESYNNFAFPTDKLVFLGAKTTCKDRWRQVLNEANRIPFKHLFTLQQGVSKNQLGEMHDEHLTLVVPKENICLFHPDYRDDIMDLSTFISMVKEKQA